MITHQDPKALSLWFEFTDDAALQNLKKAIATLAETFNTLIFPPHITLLGFSKPSEEADHVSTLVPGIITGTKEIPIEINGIGMRNSYFQSLFLTVTPSTELVSLHFEALMELEEHSDQPYMPHASLQYGELTTQQMHGALAMINRMFDFPFYLIANRLSVWNCHGFCNTWKRHSEFMLTPGSLER